MLIFLCHFQGGGLQMYMKSTNGEIEVFLCPDDAPPSEPDIKPNQPQLDERKCVLKLLASWTDFISSFFSYGFSFFIYIIHCCFFSNICLCLVPVGEHYIDVPQPAVIPNQSCTAMDSNDDIVSTLPDTNHIDLEALGLLIKTEMKSEPNSVKNEPVSQDEGHSEGLYLSNLPTVKSLVTKSSPGGLPPWGLS